jgi:hypothetical protein
LLLLERMGAFIGNKCAADASRYGASDDNCLTMLACCFARRRRGVVACGRCERKTPPEGDATATKTLKGACERRRVEHRRCSSFRLSGDKLNVGEARSCPFFTRGGEALYSNKPQGKEASRGGKKRDPLPLDRKQETKLTKQPSGDIETDFSSKLTKTEIASLVIALFYFEKFLLCDGRQAQRKRTCGTFSQMKISWPHQRRPKLKIRWNQKYDGDGETLFFLRSQREKSRTHRAIEDVTDCVRKI